MLPYNDILEVERQTVLYQHELIAGVFCIECHKGKESEQREENKLNTSMVSCRDKKNKFKHHLQVCLSR